MREFIDEHSDVHGVEPICKVLQIAPSEYRRHAAQRFTVRRRSGVSSTAKAKRWPAAPSSV